MTPPGGRRPRLLIVDDEPDMLDFLERVFRTEYEVVRATGAEEALTQLASRRFDILVTDQKMPHMSGVELLERIAAEHAEQDLVKVLLSGFTDVPEIQRAVERCGIHNYIVKPVDSERLHEAVAEAVAVKEGRSFKKVE
jgi:response regulator RpfG family c-di-GMP phosphodiesterase